MKDSSEILGITQKRCNHICTFCKGKGTQLLSSKGCVICDLYESRLNMVVGCGVLKPTFMLIGEAPGQDEDLTGFPFIGDSGQLLKDILRQAQSLCKTKLTFFFGNSVLCRPTDSKFGPNRTPKKEELVSCRNKSFSVYQYVKPKHVILVGETAAKVFGQTIQHTKILHPAYILRKGGKSSAEYYDVLTKLSGLFKSTCANEKE